MALIAEDGTTIANADSYQSLSEARTDAVNRGLTLATDDTEAEAQLRQAYYWLTSTYEAQLQGVRIDSVQTGSMPRSGVYAYGFPVPSDSIPNDFKFAQVNAASAINDGANLNAYQVGSDLISFEVVGAYKESYNSTGSANILPQMPSVAGFIYPYTKQGLNAQQGSGGLYREDMGYVG